MRLLKIFTASFVLFSTLAGIALADFDPGHLVSDSQFSDTQTFGGPQGIQQFLQTKGSVLANTSTNFLLLLKEPQDSKVKNGLGDPEPSLGRLRSAAELIWDAASMTGINPQVILVTLQKEQSLITGNFQDPNSLSAALDHALGFNCRDNSPCSQMFSGFYFQLFGNFDAQGNRYIGAPASLMRSFNTPGGRGPTVDANNTTLGAAVRVSKVGDTITLDNTQGPPNNAPATQTLTLGNLATAALYRFTPHVYNGNYNFWKFFTSWFKYPNGTLLKLSGDNNIYVINNGAKSLMAAFVMASRGLNPQTANIITVSQNEFNNYDTASPLPPPDNTIIKIDTDPSHKLYVFAQGTKHPVSDFVLKQRGLNPDNALMVSQQDADIFPSGGLLTPNDGTLISGFGDPTVYIIQNGKKMILTAFTFAQYGYSFQKVVVLPQSEVDGYDSGGYVLPKNGTLIHINGDGQKIYLLQNQILYPISYTIFQQRGYSFKNVVDMNSDQLASAGTGGFLPPAEGTYFKTDVTGSYYYYANASKHPISAFVLAQRKIAKLAITLSLEETLDMTDGSPLPPRDGTLIKGNSSPAVYVISKGLKVPLDYATWVAKYHKKAPVILDQAEVDGYSSKADQSIQQ